MNDISPLRRANGRLQFRAMDYVAPRITRVASLNEKLAGAIFTRFDARRIADEACTVDADPARRRGPLAGLTVAIKDLFDEAGEITTAGSVNLCKSAPASRDAVTVERLKSAGAVCFGRTNMSEFAYSGVGLNPHYGTPGNSADPSRIPGGSTSGGGVAVGLGLADAALGSDTGGSVRIPAALNGLAGFKPTQASVPLDGSFPLSPTCDSIGPLARSVTQCAILYAVLSGSHQPDFPRLDLKDVRLGVLQTVLTDDLDAKVAKDFERALYLLDKAGAKLKDVEADEIREAGRLNKIIISSDAMSVHSCRLASLQENADPRVLKRIQSADAFSEADRRDARERRKRAIRAFTKRFETLDALLAPTIPTIAPTIDECEADFDSNNALMLRNPSTTNFMDGCAATLPMHESDTLPTGLMIVGAAGTDWKILELARLAEQSVALAYNA